MPNTAKAREILRAWADNHPDETPDTIESIERTIRQLEKYHDIKLPFQDMKNTPAPEFRHKYTIWSNEHAGCDFDCVTEVTGMDEEIWAELTEEQIRQMAMDANENWRQDEIRNLSKPENLMVMILQSRQLWDGYYLSIRYDIVETLGHILESGYQETTIFYGDGKDIYCEDIHHDGTNRALYRLVRNAEDYMAISDAIGEYETNHPGKSDKTLKNLPDEIKQIIEEKSKSLWPYVAGTYGWPV